MTVGIRADQADVLEVALDPRANTSDYGFPRLPEELA